MAAQATQQEQELMRAVLRCGGEDGFKRFRKLSSKFAKGKIGCDDYAAYVLPLFASDESLAGMRSVLLGVIRDDAMRAELAACFERGDGRTPRRRSVRLQTKRSLNARASARTRARRSGARLRRKGSSNR